MGRLAILNGLTAPSAHLFFLINDLVREHSCILVDFFRSLNVLIRFLIFRIAVLAFEAAEKASHTYLVIVSKYIC